MIRNRANGEIHLGDICTCNVELEVDKWGITSCRRVTTLLDLVKWLSERGPSSGGLSTNIL